jgi:hypothetical protein
VRANAAEALRSLGDSGLVALDRMLDDGDRYARHQAVLMMQEAGELDRRVENLASYEADEVSRAKAWLLRVARAGQDGRLRELAERHRDPEVRGRLESLLAEEHARRAAAESDAGGAP